MKENQVPTVVRVDPVTIVIFSILFSPALICGLILLWKGVQPREGFGLCGFYILAVYWICSPRVELLPGKLIYRALMKKTSVDLTAVRSATIASRPAPTLELARAAGSAPLIGFIVKPFSKVGVAAILQHIQTESPGVQFDAVSADMMAGDFDSVTRQTLSARNMMRIVCTVASGAVGAAIVKLLMHRP